MIKSLLRSLFITFFLCSCSSLTPVFSQNSSGEKKYNEDLTPDQAMALDQEFPTQKDTEAAGTPAEDEVATTFTSHVILDEEANIPDEVIEITDKVENINELTRDLVIDQAFINAKMIPLPAIFVAPKMEDSSKNGKSLSSQEAIDSVMTPENSKKIIDLDFDEISLADILRTIGAAGSLNIVLDPILKANSLELHLKNVTIHEALTLLSDAYNLGFRKIGSSLFVTTKEKIRKENQITKVYKLKNINATEAKGLTRDLMEIVNVSEATNSLILVGTPEEITAIEEMINKIDVVQPQVILEAKIVEINKDALKDLGVDWSDSMSVQFQETGRPIDLPETAESGDGILKTFSFARTPYQFFALLRALENENKAKILSNPRVVTLNNQESEIFVGDRIPYTITTITGGVATTEVRFEEPGIRLKITPSIIQEDFVVIKIEPEVSFIFSFRGPDDQYPWVKTRRATVFVRVRNNEPFVLGGLLNQEDKKNLYKVPLIGDIPWIGNLFSYEKHTVVDSELIITVTPRIVDGHGGTDLEK